MLETIRKYSHSPIVKGVLIILAFTFLFFFGITDVIRKFTGNDYVIKVGNTKISPIEFKMEKARKTNLMQKKDIDDKKITTELVHQLIWETIINTASKDYGLIVSDGTMKKYIGSMSAFRDANGRFNPNLLRGFLRKIQVPEEMFLESSKREIKTAILKAPFAGVSLTSEVQLYAEAKNEQRSICLVELDPKDFEIIKDPSEEENIKDFFLEHREDFMIAETRSFDVLEMQELELEKKVVITDDELRDAYEMSPSRDEASFDDLKKDLEADLRREKLESITNEFSRNIEDDLIADSNVDIEKIAKKYKLKLVRVKDAEIDNDKSLAEFPYKKDIMNVAFTLDEGADSSFSESLDKNKKRVLWLVHVQSITPKHNAEYEKVADAVKNSWTRAVKHNLAMDVVNEWISKGAEKKLSQLAESIKKKVDRTSLFNREGKCVEKSKFENIINKIYTDAFKLDRNGINYIEIDGKIFVYQIDNIYTPKIEPKDLAEAYKSLASDIREDMYQELIGYLSKEYKVNINHEMLKQNNEEIDSNIDLF